MDDLGRWMRSVLDEVAPPIDPAAVTRPRPSPAPRRIAAGVVALGIIAITGGALLWLGDAPNLPSGSTTLPPTTAATAEMSTTTVTDGAGVVRLQPVRVTCSAEVDGFDCGHLIDGDPITDWQAPDGGVGATVTIVFDRPVSVLAIGFTNLADDTRFRRNGHVKTMEIHFDDDPTAMVVDLLDDNDETQIVGLGATRTLSRIDLTITAGYPGQSVGTLVPFAELALAGVEVYGYEIDNGLPDTTVTSVVGVEAPTGTWTRTNPDLGGLIVQVRDLIWDGEAFYLLTRVGFGDTSVWRSADGLEWQPWSALGTFGTTEGPWHLASWAGRIVVGGRQGTVPTVWLSDGPDAWHEVAVAASGAILDLGTWVEEELIAVGQTPTYTEFDPNAESHGVVWVSDDGATWEEAAGAEVFGGDSFPSRLAAGPAGLLVIATSGLRGSAGPVSHGAVLSNDGAEWARHGSRGLAPRQIDDLAGSASWYVATDGIDSAIAISRDGITWEPVAGTPPATGDAFLTGATAFRETIVAVGMDFVDPGGGAFNYSLPGVWIHLGVDRWEPLGDTPWFDAPGTAYRVVPGDDRLVVIGEVGPDEWALFTFVVDG